MTSRSFLISGEYLVSVKFNDQHIPDSPFKVYLAPSTGDIQKLNVSDLQEHGLQVTCCALNDGDHRYCLATDSRCVISLSFALLASLHVTLFILMVKGTCSAFSMHIHIHIQSYI